MFKTITALYLATLLISCTTISPQPLISKGSDVSTLLYKSFNKGITSFEDGSKQVYNPVYKETGNNHSHQVWIPSLERL